VSGSAFRTFTDPDAYHAAISGSYGYSHSDGVVTARGNFRADFARIQLDRVLLRHAEETLPRTAHSAMDPRQFLIAFTTDPRQQIYVSGLELVPDAIVVLRAASEGYNRYVSGSRWSGIALSHEDAAAAGQTLIGRELIAPPNTQLIKPSPPLFSKLLKLDKAVRHLAEAAPEVLAGAEVARALEQALTRVMIQCLSEGQGIEVRSVHWRHAAMMRRLENFLEANPDRTDKDLARRLARDLQSANVHVWLDQWEIGVGEEFVQRIEKGLDEVDFVVVLLTRASVNSEWVDREWRHKVQHEAETKRIAVVPVRGEPCEILSGGGSISATPRFPKAARPSCRLGCSSWRREPTWSAGTSSRSIPTRPRALSPSRSSRKPRHGAQPWLRRWSLRA